MRLALLVFCLIAACRAHAMPPEGDALPPYAVRAALERLAPQRPGRIDLYAIVVAGDGEQDVFRKESETVRRVLDERLGTAGRSLLLVNHYSLPEPEATLKSIEYALGAVARRMDPEEDVLLLHFTSHGAAPARDRREHELLLRHPAVSLYALTPLALRAMLDDAGIRNRVIVVSACFSGGFVPPLATDDTLIITASSHDRPSYGCGNDSVITDFSRALYLKAIAETGSLRDAARRAMDLVEADESAQKQAHSYPQVRSGQAIDERLKIWERELQAR